MLKILKYLTKKDWLLVLYSFAFVIVQVYLDLKLPDYMSEITMLVQTSNSEMGEILRAGEYMLSCALGSLLASFIVGYFASKIATNLSWRLRSNVYDKIEGFSPAEINKFSTASLITRSTNDITQVQNMVAMGLQLIMKAPITALWALGKILDKGWQWSLATGVAVLILICVILIIVVFALPRTKVMQKLTDKLNLITRENLTGIRVVRAYNANIQDKMTLFSDMIVFSSYSIQVIMAFIMLTMIFIIMPRDSVSAKRILEVLENGGFYADLYNSQFEKVS